MIPTHWQGFYGRDIIPSAHGSAAPAKAGTITTALNHPGGKEDIKYTLHILLQVHGFFSYKVFFHGHSSEAVFP